MRELLFDDPTHTGSVVTCFLLAGMMLVAFSAADSSFRQWVLGFFKSRWFIGAVVLCLTTAVGVAVCRYLLIPTFQFAVEVTDSIIIGDVSATLILRWTFRIGVAITGAIWLMRMCERKVFRFRPRKAWRRCLGGSKGCHLRLIK